MKVALIALSFTCLIGLLEASPLNYGLEETDFNTFVEPEPQVFPNFEDEFKPKPPKPSPIPPRPTTPSPPPKPTTPKTKPTRPPQIHHNAIRSQGPLSGRLTNIVQNMDGTQRTIQKNRIDFNYLYADSVKKMLEEAMENNDA